MTKKIDRLQRLVRRFRILRGWRIRWDQDKDFSGGLTCNAHKHHALIYTWNEEVEKKPEPRDYLLHEVLHCALSAFNAMDRRKPKALREVEEQLVQDICAIACANIASGALGDQHDKNQG